MKAIDKKLQNLDLLNKIIKEEKELYEASYKRLQNFLTLKAKIQDEINELERTEIPSTPTSEETRKFVMQFMSYSGEYHDVFSQGQFESEWAKAYLLCDGFGKIDLAFAIEQCWDWSHVRDSSDEAFANVKKFIRASKCYAYYFGR